MAEYDSGCQKFVGSCDVCQQAKDPIHFKKNKVALHLWTVPDSPWVQMHADLFTMGKKTEQINTHTQLHKKILVMIDAFTKLVELAPLKDKEAKTVAAAIVATWTCRYTCPKQIITDSGREFCKKL